MNRAAMAGALVAVLLTGGWAAADSDAQQMSRHEEMTVSAGTYQNPVYPENAPDPQAIQVDGHWYLFHTNVAGRNVPVLTSPDLVEWTPAGDALPTLPRWAAPGRTWAPGVIALASNRYVMYYTAAARREGRQCIGRAVSTTPQGPYQDSSPGPLVCQADEGGSIDASPFADTDGRLWLVWKNDGNAIGRNTWLYAQQLSADGSTLTGRPARLVRQTEPWEGRSVEAPFFWRHEGRLLLFYSANAFNTAAYAQGYAVCQSPQGPCVKAPENPVLRSNDVASGPGGGFLVRKDGRSWLLYHAWQPGAEGSEPQPGRQLWLSEVTWVNGRPVVDPPSHEPRPRP